MANWVLKWVYIFWVILSNVKMTHVKRRTRRTTPKSTITKHTKNLIVFSKKFSDQNFFGPKILFWTQNFFKTFLSDESFFIYNIFEKNFGLKKNLGQKNFVCSVIVDFGVVLIVTWVIWTPKLSQKPMIGLCVKFQPSSTPPSDRFWWGILLVVTGVKKSQLFV